MDGGFCFGMKGIHAIILVVMDSHFVIILVVVDSHFVLGIVYNYRLLHTALVQIGL